MPNLKLQSSDGEIFEVDVEVAKCSETIKEMLENLGMEDDEDSIPLPNVASPILKKVIEWGTHHKDDSPESTSDDEDSENGIEMRKSDLSPWDTQFLKVDQATLFELILAANYLNIKNLLDAASRTIANMIRHKSPEEIRQTFNIENDFTPEEEKKIREELSWCNDS